MPNKNINVIPRKVNNDDYNIKLRDLASAKGLSIDWNNDTRAVSIGGQPFDTTNWQNIGGYHMGNESMANDFLKNYQVPTGNVNVRGVPPKQATERASTTREMPSGTITDTSTPIYPNEINKVTRQYGDAVQGFGNEYKLDNDPIYKSLADYQDRRMMQLAGRTGSHYDSNTQARIGQANMQLGLQFQQSHEARQLQNIQNLQGQLNTLTGLEDRALKNNTQIYGMALTPKTNDYMTTMQNLTPEQTQYVSQYSNDFAAEINNLPEGDPNRKMLEAARFHKVIGDPVAYRDYLIGDYGLSPFQVDGIVMNKKLEEAQLTATNEKEAMEFQKLMLQLEKQGFDTIKAGFDAEKAGIGVDAANVALTKAEFDTQTAFWKSFMAEVEASNISDKQKADLRKTYAEIENIQARTQATNVAKSLNQKKLNELTVDYSEGVQDGFKDLVSHLSQNGTVLSWLNSTSVWDENEKIELKTSEMYSRKELEDIFKLANNSKLITTQKELSFAEQFLLNVTAPKKDE